MKRNFTEYTKLAYEVYWFKKQCEICLSLEKICVHHKDENPSNNSKDNLQILCSLCHNRLHKKNKKLSIKIRNNMSLARKWIIFTETHKNNIKISLRWRKLSEECKRKMSKVRIWKKLWIKLTQEHKNKIKENHWNKRKVTQYDLDWNFIKTWNTLTEITQNLWIYQSNILKCCNWLYSQSWWYKWRYFTN